MSIDDLPYTADEAYQGGFERTPPQDIPAEQSVLGGMLLSKDAIAEVIEVIKAIDFYKPAHEAVFGAILELYGRGEPADPVTVAALLTKKGDINRIGGAPYLHTLINSVPTAANAGYYAEIVKERAVLRRLVEAGTRIVQMGYGTDGSDVEQIVDAAQQEMYSVTEQRTSEDFIPLADAMEGALDEIESISNRSGQMTGVPTGFHDLDALTNGLHPGQMVIIAARPAIGKSTLGTGPRPQLLHQERPDQRHLLPGDGPQRDHHAPALRRGPRRPAPHAQRHDDRRGLGPPGPAHGPTVSEAPLFIDDSPNMSMMEIRAKCRRLKQRHDLQLVIIDYLQLMQHAAATPSARRAASRKSPRSPDP